MNQVQISIKYMNNKTTQIYAGKAILDSSRVQLIMLLPAGKSQ